MSTSALHAALETIAVQSASARTHPASGLIGPVGLELRQVSGLGAGAAHPIPARGLTYTGGRNETGFRLDADADGEFVLTPLGAPVRLDDRPISSPTVVGTNMIQLGHASFLIAERRRPGRSGSAGSGLRHDTVPSRRSVLEFDDANPSSGEFTAALARAHREAVRAHRYAWPDPEEIIHQSVDGGARRFSRPATHPLFGQAAVAQGPVPWSVRLDRAVQVSMRCQTALSSLQSLPAIPLPVDLRTGPLGLVGPREGTLAMARSVVLSLATLSPVGDVSVSFHHNPRQAHDWSWADDLPHRVTSGEEPAETHSRTPLAIEVCDLATRSVRPGSIVIADDPDRLPDSCDDVVIVSADGTCTVLDHRTELMHMGASPFGLGEPLAAVAVAALADAEARRVEAAQRPPASRRARFHGAARQAARVRRPRRTDFRRSPIGSAPTQHGYEYSFF